MGLLMRLAATLFGRLSDACETVADNLERDSEPHLTVVPDDTAAATPATDAETPVPDDAEHLRAQAQAQSVSEAAAAAEKAT